MIMPTGALPFAVKSYFEGQEREKECPEAMESLLARRDSFDQHIFAPSSSSHRYKRAFPRREAITFWLKRFASILGYTLIVLLTLNGLYHVLQPLGAMVQSSGLFGAAVTDENSCNCGSSLTEAMARSCRYDTIAAAWLPPHCRDDELIAEFDAAGPGEDGQWTYYADEYGNSTITPGEIALLPANETNHYFYATHAWHVLHCSYYWRKMHRMVHGTKGAARRIEHRFDTLGHLGHCEMMFLKRGPLDAIVTGSGVSLTADIVSVHVD